MQDKTVGEGASVGLLGAALPAAVAGFLALSMSAIFADTVTINSSSNTTTPFLWQLPIDFTGRRKKRHAGTDDDFDFGLNSENELDSDMSSGSSLGGLFSSMKYDLIASRIRTSMLLFSLIDADSNCRYRGSFNYRTNLSHRQCNKLF